MVEEFTLSSQHEQWAAKGRRKYRMSPTLLKQLIVRQRGKCALSGADLIFDKNLGNPNTRSEGCHPLYAAIDHISPSCSSFGFQLVCYDLNDLKGHLPYKVFKELIETTAWKKLMQEWAAQAMRNPGDIEAFNSILRD